MKKPNKTPTVKIYKGRKWWHYRVRAANGEIVVPNEGHTRATDAKRAFLDMVAAIEALPRDENGQIIIELE